MVGDMIYILLKIFRAVKQFFFHLETSIEISGYNIADESILTIIIRM